LSDLPLQADGDVGKNFAPARDHDVGMTCQDFFRPGGDCRVRADTGLSDRMAADRVRKPELVFNYLFI